MSLDIIRDYKLALFIAFNAGYLNIDLNANMIHSWKHEIKLFIKTYNTAKHLYPATEDYVKEYNTIRETQFTVEQLEKYLLLI